MIFLIVGWKIKLGKKKTHVKNTVNFSTLSLQRVVVRHTLASMSQPNAPQLHLQHKPFTVSDVGQLREKQANQRWCGTWSNGKTLKQTSYSGRMVKPRAWHHKAVFCEALVMPPSMCTHYCWYHDQCRDCHQWRRSSLRWLIRVSFTKADNNSQSLVSCLDQKFYSDEDLFGSDTPGQYKHLPLLNGSYSFMCNPLRLR